MKNYVWHKQKVVSPLAVIDCKPLELIKDFRRDPTGFYVLIRCDKPKQFIEVAICDKTHVVVKIFRGRKAWDMYAAIFDYEKKHKLNWFSRKDHIAYLGKELKKAEFDLAGKETYLQE